VTAPLLTLLSDVRARMPRLGRSNSDCRGLVLMFHEIFGNDQDYVHAFKAGCTAAFLEAVIVELRRARWDIVSFDEAMERLIADKASRRFAVLTFDDGYRDNLTEALPILERHGAPFTIYTPTGALTRELNSWWLALRALFQKHDSIEIAAMGEKLTCPDIGSKTAGNTRVKQWVHEDYDRVVLLDETFTRYGISIGELNDSYFMGPSELRSLSAHHLAGIGAHTTSHRPLANLKAAEVEQEMSDNRKHLEALLDRPILHLAYPYGNALACGEREYRAAKQLGFHTAVTTQESPVFSQHRLHPHQMPRIGLSGTMTHFAYFSAHIRKLRNADAGDFAGSSL
jgi:peptidoglycan/xylan/chitin deacetylase (PgdA/CDA1 family)